MASNQTRRPQSKRAPGSALLAPDRPLQSIVQSHLVQEARASVVLDREQTHVLDSLVDDDGELVEDPELEEVVVEPDLPAEPELTPEQQARLEYEALVDAMDPQEPVYVAGDRAPRLKVGDYTLMPGETVPGAHSWSRRESWETTGRIVRKG